MLELPKEETNNSLKESQEKANKQMNKVTITVQDPKMEIKATQKTDIEDIMKNLGK